MRTIVDRVLDSGGRGTIDPWLSAETPSRLPAARPVAQEVVQALLAGQELERKRLARELHDETAQALTSILLGLKALEAQVGEEPLALIRRLVCSALDDVRRLAVELRPAVLDDFGLEPALDHLAAVVAEQSGLAITVSFAARGERPTAEQETALYRVVQQALTNVVNHAEARSVRIAVSGGAGTVRTVIEDDGAGFDPARVRAGALGVVGMRERVLLLGGCFEIHSSPGTGTAVVVELPARGAGERLPWAVETAQSARAGR